MEELTAWLDRMRSQPPENLARFLFRLFVPGHQLMNYDKWLMTTEQPKAVPSGFRGGYPETAGLLALLDEKDEHRRVQVHQRLVSDLATVMSLAFTRRIDIPYELALTVEGQESVSFLPLGHVADRVITGPLPADSKSRLIAVLEAVAGLPPEDLPTISTAASMFHGALMLHASDIRAAYTLLVSGMEILSRRYGSPPEDWSGLDGSDSWDALFTKQLLSDTQAATIRSQLLLDKQLRLKATFRSYVSQRLPDSFWDHEWSEWHYSIRLPEGIWGEPQEGGKFKVRDFLPVHRDQLAQALGKSYDLRSSFVHSGLWFGPLELSFNPADQLDMKRPLPFAVLRAILGELLFAELDIGGSNAELPKVELEREWMPNI